MDCRHLQRYLLAVPAGSDAEVRRHLAECASCRRMAADLQRFEHLLEAAALSVPVPEGLSARVLLDDGSRRGAV
jgi:hypothetical protein